MQVELKVENVLPLAAEWTGVAARPADEENGSRGWKMADGGRRDGFQTSCCMHLRWNLEANQSQQPSVGRLQKPPVLYYRTWFAKKATCCFCSILHFKRVNSVTSQLKVLLKTSNFLFLSPKNIYSNHHSHNC